MKKFILKLLSLAILTTIVIVGFMLLIYESKRVDHDIKIEKPYLVLGDSHLHTSLIDDNYLSNYAYTAETYEEALNKINYLENEPDTIILAYSFCNIDVTTIRLRDQNKFDANRILKNYNFGGLRYLAKYWEYAPTIPQLIANIRSLDHLTQDVVGYDKIEGSHLSKASCLKKIEQHFGENIDSEKAKLSKKSIKYLRQLISKSSVVYLVNIPLNSCYRALVPQNIEEEYYSLADELINNYNNVYI